MQRYLGQCLLFGWKMYRWKNRKMFVLCYRLKENAPGLSYVP